MSGQFTGRIARHSGGAFEDILDGYFPLEESLRQMLVRHGFDRMWVTLRHAPVMTLPGVGPRDPVPLYLPKTYSGMIDHMTLCVTSGPDRTPRISGAGHWYWVDGRDNPDRFTATTRLGEPAFVCGIGMGAPQHATGATVVLADDPKTAVAHLGWARCAAWPLVPQAPGLELCTDADTRLALLDDAEDPGAGAGLPIAAGQVDARYLLVDTTPAPFQPDF